MYACMHAIEPDYNKTDCTVKHKSVRKEVKRENAISVEIKSI